MLNVLKSLMVLIALATVGYVTVVWFINTTGSFLSTPVFGYTVSEERDWWTAAAMIVHFENDHQGEGPKDWEELRPYFIEVDTLFGKSEPGEGYDNALGHLRHFICLGSPRLAKRVIAYREMTEASSWFSRCSYVWTSEQDKKMFESVSACYESRSEEIGYVSSPRPQ